MATATVQQRLKILNVEKGFESDKKINYTNCKRKKKKQNIMVHRSDLTQGIHLVLSPHWKGQWNLKYR